ncbi:MAG TPA: pilus assembly protein N-terminal domain-containing protein [Planctomycetaceae bacterium]|nr:pilus assembly protein N-terminal domain-containing protein [Planctomycetaceae bacterium]
MRRILSKRSSAPWAALLLLACGWCPALSWAQAQPNAAPLGGDTIKITTPTASMEIAERFSKVAQFPKKLVRLDGFDPTVVSVTPLSPDLVRISALEQGVTTLVATDEAQQTYSVEIFVSGDTRLLQTVLKRHFPNTAITAMKVRDSVLLRGWVSEPQQISEITQIAKMHYPNVLNQMKVGGPQEVQLRVQVMEVQRTQIRRFGINFVAGGKNATFASTPGPIAPISSLVVPFGGPPVAGLTQSGLSNASMALGIASDSFVFQGLVQALKQEGLLKIQAEPLLVTRSGEPARLVNGGEFPIPVPGGLGTVTIEWREFGVLLESLPIIVSPTRLRQQITAEVSERDFNNAATLSGTTVPALTKRTVQTNVEMEFGQTLVIGGLISTRYTAQTDKIPFLGELPGIGAAFRRVRYDTAETELLVMITPEYVGGMSPDQLPPGGVGQFTTVPTDRELYKGGLIEVPAYTDPGFCPPPGAGPMVVPGPASAPMMSPALPGNDPNLILPPPAVPPAPILEGADARPRTSSSKTASRSRSVTTEDGLPPSPVTPAGYRGASGESGLIEPASGKKTVTRPTTKSPSFD